MKNRLLFITLTIFFINVAGCSSTSSTEVPYEQFELTQEDENTPEKENAVTESEMEQTEMTVTPSEATESTDFTFADLAKRQFEFCSGAGGWSEEFTIEKDGYFTGNFHDSDMGSIGEGYEDGTIFCCSYSGHFSDLTKINDYTYTMKLTDISYDETVNTEEISDNIRWIYTDSYCLGGTDTFTIYLPGTPVSELSEEVLLWLFMANADETELDMIAIVDETNEYGIYSYERRTPFEDAQMTLESYKYSYDEYSNQLSEANNTLEMVEYSESMYEISDDCLNYIWNLVRYNTEEEEYNKILAEQREWISEKETKAKEASSEYEGGSLASVTYNETLATLTMKRCEELIEYLK